MAWRVGAFACLLLQQTLGAEMQNTEVGPFGLAFPFEMDAVQSLSCDGLRGRPFVTGLHVQQVSAPFGGRDAYEFRIQCGPALSEWTDLGPPLLMWSSSKQGSAQCPRPQSVRGMAVTRGRSEASRSDLFGFSLVCGQSGSETVDVDGLNQAQGSAEQRGRQCREGAFVSGLEIRRGFERQGAYDLYEFVLTCSEVIERNEPPPPPPEGFSTRSFAATARGDSGDGSMRVGGGGGGGGG